MEVLKVDSAALKQKAVAIRHEVFVDEQGVPAEAEQDEHEDNCTHFVVLDSNADPVGAARYRQTEKGIKLERFAVKKTARGTGIGSKLVEAALEDIRMQYGQGIYVYLHSQLSAVPLYSKFNFLKEGEQFEECDIMHYKMYRKS